MLVESVLYECRELAYILFDIELTVYSESDRVFGPLAAVGMKFLPIAIAVLSLGGPLKAVTGRLISCILALLGQMRENVSSRPVISAEVFVNVKLAPIILCGKGRARSKCSPEGVTVRHHA